MQVVTTIGPRKPQRQASCANSSITSEIIDPSVLLLQAPDQLACPHSPNLQNALNQQLTPNVSHRVCLETSFTSLQSPNDLAPTDKNEAKTVVGTVAPPVKTKSVAFSNSNGIAYPPSKYKPTTLSLCETRPNPFDGNKVDLIYDDWFGLAPLASPESLSELSSISSRASIALNLNLAGSIEKYLNKYNTNKNTSSTVTTPSTIPANPEVFESQLHTPKVMRRTPKISDNLATCADDWRSINSYKRMGLVFLTNPRIAFVRQ